MSVEERLRELSLSLPEAPAPLGAYVPCRRSGGLVFLSGMLPLRDGALICSGRVGGEVTLEEAQAACRQAVLNALAALRTFLGDLERVAQCVKVTGFVSSAEGFTGQPAVLNAASELLYEIFGEKGRHARAAVGVSILPLNSPVEIDFIFEAK